ncbi:monocarboxylate transporter 13-like isoform X2 [Haliotis rufescens]|uniref:monocarboxylate transporter 13-like isoform X1 n=1 Tax=Haliotis rufescens TaxID=6454 RepID=UPI001EB02C5E|nr:monocarboxylate transporter 13-like isoform X1 [Haliotis rufescens]XP_046325617.1 monocarboxylate transporter 13-like isoform X2 [Haliotis rufescens]
MPNVDVTNLSDVLRKGPGVCRGDNSGYHSQIVEERGHDSKHFARTNTVWDEENALNNKIPVEEYDCRGNKPKNDVICDSKKNCARGGCHGSSCEIKVQDNGVGKRERRKYWQIMSVVSGFIVNLFAGGLPNSYGIMYTYMKEPLGVTEEELSWIGSLMNGFIGISSVLGMVCLDSLGARRTTMLGGVLATTGFIIGSQMHNLYVLYFSFGVLPGIGISLGYTANMVNVNTHFSKWRPLAIGVSITGISVGMLIWPPMCSLVSDTLGWQGTFLINGALTLHFIPCALWMTPSNSNDFSNGQSLSVSQTLVNCFQIFRIPGAVTVSIAHVTLGFSYYTFSTFIPEYVTTSMSRLTATQAALVVTTPGYGSMAGRILFSGISMSTVKATNYIFLLSICGMGITNLLIPLCANATAFYINGAVYGLTLGGFSSVLPLVLVQLFGLHNLSKTFGTFMMCLGFGAFGGSPIQSYLAKKYDRDTPFYLAGSSFILTMLLLLWVVMRKQMALCTRKSDNLEVEGVDNCGFSTGGPHTTV